MKTKLLLFATLLITTISFSQTSKKGYDYYKAKSDVSQSKKMNKAELIDAMAKDANSSVKKYGKMGNHPNTSRHNWINSPSRAKNSKQTNDLLLRKRPGRTKFGTKISTEGQTHRSQGDPVPGIGITKEQGNSKHLRKRPGRTIYKKASANNIVNPPITTNATDYNSSRSNKSF